jgi:hypothetical protein
MGNIQTDLTSPMNTPPKLEKDLLIFRQRTDANDLPNADGHPPKRESELRRIVDWVTDDFLQSNAHLADSWPCGHDMGGQQSAVRRAFCWHALLRARGKNLEQEPCSYSIFTAPVGPDTFIARIPRKLQGAAGIADC